MGYTLDSKPYVTINGNTTMKLPEDGTHSIELHSILCNGEFIKSKNVTFSISTNSITEPSSPAPNLDWIFPLIFLGLIGITSLITIITLVNRRKIIKKIYKEKTPVEVEPEVSSMCPYCHTEIDLNSNYCPYCSSKIKG